MTAEKYNGWTNYETWDTALWMGESDSYYNEIAQEAYNQAEADGTFTREERAAFDLEDRLKDDFEENAPELPAGFYSDMLTAAMSEINWYEIAEHYIEDVDKETEQERG
jgi:hypothetical protein